MLSPTLKSGGTRPPVPHRSTPVIGVPRGSILGPLFVLIICSIVYINEILKATNMFNVNCMYADDTMLFSTTDYFPEHEFYRTEVPRWQYIMNLTHKDT